MKRSCGAHAIVGSCYGEGSSRCLACPLSEMQVPRDSVCSVIDMQRAHQRALWRTSERCFHILPDSPILSPLHSLAPPSGWTHLEAHNYALLPHDGAASSLAPTTLPAPASSSPPGSASSHTPAPWWSCKCPHTRSSRTEPRTRRPPGSRTALWSAASWRAPGSRTCPQRERQGH